MAAVSDVTPFVSTADGENPFVKPPVGDNAFAKITDNVARVAEAPRPPRAWYRAATAGVPPM